MIHPPACQCCCWRWWRFDSLPEERHLHFIVHLFSVLVSHFRSFCTSRPWVTLTEVSSSKVGLFLFFLFYLSKVPESFFFCMNWKMQFRKTQFFHLWQQSATFFFLPISIVQICSSRFLESQSGSWKWKQLTPLELPRALWRRTTSDTQKKTKRNSNHKLTGASFKCVDSRINDSYSFFYLLLLVSAKIRQSWCKI